MKKVIIFDASPRKNGNCDVITEKLKSEIKDAEVEVFKLRDEKIGPCLACGSCKTQDTPTCVQHDHMAGMIGRIDACDAIALVAPIYFGQINGPAKIFIDRLYCFFNPAKQNSSVASKRQKKAVVICSCGGPSSAYQKVAESTAACFAGMGADETKGFVCGGASALGACKNNEEQIQAICDIAKWIV